MNRFFLILLVISLSACGGGGSSSQNLPSIEFSEEYSLSDFNLNSEYIYWEIRRGALPNQSPDEYRVRAMFDESAFSQLDATQTQIIRNVTSQNGFKASCPPSFCPIYAVAIEGYVVRVIDSGFDLLEFFDEIDTEAELEVWLNYHQGYASSTNALFYEEVEDGYRVILAWDSLCLSRGEDLVKVYRDGSIEKIEEISREVTSTCV